MTAFLAAVKRIAQVLQFLPGPAGRVGAAERVATFAGAAALGGSAVSFKG